MGPSVLLYKIVSSTNLPPNKQPFRWKSYFWRVQLVGSGWCRLCSNLKVSIVQLVKLELMTLFWRSVHSPPPPPANLFPDAKQPQDLGSPEHWLGVRKTTSLLTHHSQLLFNTCSQPVPGAPLPEIWVLLREHLAVPYGHLGKQIKPVFVACVSIFITWQLSKRKLLVRFKRGTSKNANLFWRGLKQILKTH